MKSYGKARTGFKKKAGGFPGPAKRRWRCIQNV
jgi:hypothetical protein